MPVTAAILLCSALDYCVYDVANAERASTIMPANVCWRQLNDLMGWNIPDEKSPPPCSVSLVIGALTDFTPTPWAPAKLQISKQRAEHYSSHIILCVMSEKMYAGFTGKLLGRLNWSSCLMFGRLGRAKLRPFFPTATRRRTHEPQPAAAGCV